MKFFVVVRARGELVAHKRYDTYEEAAQEATRLAKKERAKFHVLGCVSTIDIQLNQEQPTKWTYQIPLLADADTHTGTGEGRPAADALRGVGASVVSGIGSRGQEKD